MYLDTIHPEKINVFSKLQHRHCELIISLEGASVFKIQTLINIGIAVPRFSKEFSDGHGLNTDSNSS